MKNIAILGSTGSIGKTLIKILSKDKKNFSIVLLTANKNYKDLLKQTETFKVKNVIITNARSYQKFNLLNKDKSIKVFSNFDCFENIFKNKIDYTMSAIVGLNGLNPTLKIIKYSNKIAIANKESIICGWNLIKKEIDKYKTKFIPVDSEHFSMWYALDKKNLSNINKVFLTASGGPLLNVSFKKLSKIKIKDVLKHPNWRMGKKITVDSATMMNKVFEIIEAKNIFNLKLSQLDIIVHPQSFIHTVLHLKDGMIKFIAHKTTMEIPIFNSLYEGKNSYSNNSEINIVELNKLKFMTIDKKKFPVLKIISLIPKKISLFETVLISANDELVKLYLNKKIKFNELHKKLFNLINLNEFVKLKKIKPKCVLDIINLDKYVRLKINSKVYK